MMRRVHFHASLPKVSHCRRSFRSTAIGAGISEDPTMSLQNRLDGFRAAFESGYPPHSVPRPIIEIMEKATAELAASGAADRALREGDIAPPFVLNDARGAPVSS